MNNDIERESREAFEQFAIKELGITARGESPGWRIWQAALEWQAARAQSGQGADPVAWTWISGGRHVTADKPYADQLKVDGLDVSPLYTHPHSGEQGGEWVSVKDKQPPILEQCLGWNATANMINKANTYRLFTAAMENTCDISHWMPLPQPPKSKESEGDEH